MGKRFAKASGSSGGGKIGGGEHELTVAVADVRFAHSRVSRWFSGCGLRLEETLQQILDGKLTAAELPKILVLLSPDAPGAFFSLNNRRTWVFKQLHARGRLDQIVVRARPATPKERARYTVERCALHATLLGLDRPGEPSQADGTADDDPVDDHFGPAEELGDAEASTALPIAEPAAEPIAKASRDSERGPVGRRCLLEWRCFDARSGRLTCTFEFV